MSLASGVIVRSTTTGPAPLLRRRRVGVVKPLGCWDRSADGGRPPCTPGPSTWSSSRSLQCLRPRKPGLGGGFALRCLQRLSGPDLATQRCRRAGQLAHQRSVRPNPLVLGETLLKLPTPTADRDRPVSRRSEPSSRTAFIGEQPNPWDLLQPQDAMSRHRGAKPPRRYGRSGEISLLSPEYLLSVERRPFHPAPPDH